jgi:hypothetical protein
MELRASDPHDLVIDRFRTRLELAGRHDDGPGFAREVTRTVRELVPPSCSRALEPRLRAGAGVVRIDRLSLRLSVGREGLSAPALADRLAEEVARRIADAIAGQDGGASGVATWSDHATFAAAYVAHRLSLRAAPAWAFPDFRALDHLSPADAAVELVAARPATLPALVKLLDTPGGAARLAAALPERAAMELVERLAMAAAPSDIQQHGPVLAALVAALPEDPAASPGRAALGAALTVLRSGPGEPQAVRSLLVHARVAAALVVVARAVWLRVGRAPEARDLDPEAMLHLPAPARELARAWLSMALVHAADRPALIAALAAVSPRRTPGPAGERPSAAPDGASASPLAPTVLASRIAGVGLLMPAALRHDLPGVLSPAAFHRVLIGTLAGDARAAASRDPLPATLAPFDPRDGEPVLPPVPASLRAAVPEGFRHTLAEVEGVAGWAGCLLHAFAAMLPGFEASSPGYLRAQFLAQPGRLVVDRDRMSLLLAPMPLGIVLRHAGLHGWTGRLPHARDALLRIEVEDSSP